MAVLMEILEWADCGRDEMTHRIPQAGSADIKMGAQLVVQESQTAIFFRDGKCLDRLGPGRHTLSTLNLPLVTRLLALPFGFQSPFRAAVYFVSRKIYPELKWGTKNPVVFRDRELGAVRLRAYGRYSLRVEDPVLFLNAVVGPTPTYSVVQLEDYFRDVIVARLNDLMGEQLQSLYDLPAVYNELGAAAKVRIREDFSRFGLELVDFFVNSVTPPEEVQRMIDERTGLSAVGDLNDFLRYEAAKAIGGQGGPSQTAVAGTTMEAGLGAGLGLAMVPNLLQNALAPKGGGIPCSCGQLAPQGASFCPHCGANLHSSALCPDCRAATPAGSKFCPQCGHALETPPQAT